MSRSGAAWRLGVAIFSLPALLACGQQARQAVRLSVPPEIYAVPGVPLSLYFQNAVPSQRLEGLRFGAECGIGRVEGNRRWTLAAKETEAGDHPLVLTVTDENGSMLDTAKTVVRVVPATAGEDETVSVLVVGDSLTNASIYPNELSRLFSRPGNPRLRMIGSHQPAAAADGVWHEGYGGWSWARFLSKFQEGNTAKDKTRNSPFLFRKPGAEKPQLDFAAYFEAQGNGSPPDFVTVLLGINDCFHPDPDDPAAVEARIDSMLANAETFLAALRKAAPGTEIGICLTPPPNLREEAFEANYKGRYTWKGWRRIQFELVERELAHFGSREDEKLFVVPTSLNLDPVGGYPDNNAVHPNAEGYAEIAASIYGWMKWRLSRREGDPTAPNAR